MATVPVSDLEVDQSASVLTHPNAEQISLRLDEGSGGLSLTVADDGVGFEPDEAGLRSRRLGLTSMEERARGLGARLRIESAPGAGTTIELEVDCDADSRPDR